MTKRNIAYWPIITAVAGVFILIVALPSEWKSWAPSFLRPSYHFGLDLAGGTQLDFRISEDEIQRQLAEIDEEIRTLETQGASVERINAVRFERQAIEQQQVNIVEAIRNVLERRINALGVSEAVITPSYVGDEKHLLVECPGVVDVQQCIATVGKTIQLEFKEQATEADDAFEAQVRERVAQANARLENGDTLTTVGQDLGDELGIAWQQSRPFFRDELPEGLDALWNAQSNQVRQIEGSVTTLAPSENGGQEEQEVPGIFLVQALNTKTSTGRVVNRAEEAFTLLAQREEGLRYRLVEEESLDDNASPNVAAAVRSMQNGEMRAVQESENTSSIVFLRGYAPGQQLMEASHILVAYEGSGVDPEITRSKEEAQAKAQELKQRLDSGEDFNTLARTESDGPSAQNAGSLGEFGRGAMVPSFEAAAFSLTEGQVSTPIETAFGYHIIRADKAPHNASDIASFEVLEVTGADAQVRAQALIAQMQAGEVKKEEEVREMEYIFFSLIPTGWKDTELDGTHFRSASASADTTTGFPVVQIVFDQEGGEIFAELTRRNIGKQIAIFVGGQLVSAPTVQAEITGGTAVITGLGSFENARLLAQDLNTGAIPAPIHLAGQRTVEPTLGAEALRTSLQAGVIGILILMLYMLFTYRFLGVLADLALLSYAVIFLALLKLPLFLVTGQYIVLTLAGAAGLILSIGMAVDTNVLIFERVKEELKRGKGLKTSIETGFSKAWPSIRDSNVSTLMTCVILFVIGTSIVRGFAVTLATGVLISMFTGIIVSKWLALQAAKSGLYEKKPWLFGIKR